MIDVRCPYCQKDQTKVTETRESDEDITRRRRECLSCGKRFTTYERIEAIDLTIIKKDGSREQFSMDKLIGGMSRACNKRPVEHEQIEMAAESIERALRRRKGTEVPSRVVGELVMKKLKRLDSVAYIRFASVYRGFSDVDRFSEEIQKLKA